VVTIYHLRELADGKRRKIKCNDVKVIQLPYYDGLSIQDILEYATGYDNGKAMEALPIVQKEILKLPRAYIANVCHTIIGDPFQAWANK